MSNDTQTPTLADFLLARIAGDAETAARAVGRGIMWAGLADGVAAHDANAGWHVLRWHPARVLAECEAKRRIVEYATGQHTSSVEGYEIMEMLGVVYADHADYREEWRP